MNRTRRSDKSFILLIVIVLITIGTAVYGYFQFRTDQFTEMAKRGEPINILFVFTDQEQLVFMELLLYDPTTRRAGVFHIPANLGTQIAELDRFDRLGVLYKPEDISALKQKTESVLGIDIPFTITMSFSDVVGVVDTLGGLELFISNPIDQDTPQGRALLPSGSVVLDGDKVLQYLQYQEPLEQEMEIASRKQKFLQAFLKKLGQPETQDMLALGQAESLFLSFLETNISPRGVEVLVQEVGKLDADRLIFQRVVGNRRQVEGVSGDVLFPHYEGVLIHETIAQISEAIRSEEVEIEDALEVTIQILNGTNIDGLARRTKALYESFGFDVVGFTNADNDKYINTIVLDRRAKPAAARRVAEIIHCERIHSRTDPSADADVTLILGRDFDGRYIKR